MITLNFKPVKLHLLLLIFASFVIIDYSTAHHEKALKIGDWNVSITTDPAQHKRQNARLYRHYRSDDDSDLDPKKLVKEVEDKILNRIAKEKNSSAPKQHRMSIAEAKVHRRRRLQKYLQERKYKREDPFNALKYDKLKGKSAGRFLKKAAHADSMPSNFEDREKNAFNDNNFNDYRNSDDGDGDDDYEQEEDVQTSKTNLGSSAPVAQSLDDSVSIVDAKNSDFNNRGEFVNEDYSMDDGDDDDDDELNDFNEDGDDDDDRYTRLNEDGNDDDDEEDEGHYSEDAGKYEYLNDGDDDDDAALQEDTENSVQTESATLEDPENYNYQEDPENFNYLDDPENFDGKENNLEDSGYADIFEDGDDDEDADGDDDDDNEEMQEENKNLDSETDFLNDVKNNYADDDEYDQYDDGDDDDDDEADDYLDDDDDDDQFQEGDDVEALLFDDMQSLSDEGGDDDDDDDADGDDQVEEDFEEV